LAGGTSHTLSGLDREEQIERIIKHVQNARAPNIEIFDESQYVKLDCADCGMRLAVLEVLPGKVHHRCTEGLPKPFRLLIQGEPWPLDAPKYPTVHEMIGRAVDENNNELYRKTQRSILVSYIRKQEFHAGVDYILTINQDNGRIGLDPCICGDCWKVEKIDTVTSNPEVATPTRKHDSGKHLKGN
ncbi:MAG: hypothetical protein MI867_29880, partial [Pseudomonadales bacterium]|nr:hypothetical protein [Pseudomonadales bacterium]